MGAKINFLAMLAAAAAFFLPWLEVSCTVDGEDRVLFTQSGIQTVTGKVTEGPDLKELRGSRPEREKDGADAAILVAIAGGFVGFGVLASLVAAGGKGGTGLVGILAAVALALIVTQMVLEFPAVAESSEPGNELQKEVSKQVRELVKDRYREGLYVELGALAVPVLVLLAGGVRRGD